MTVHPPVENLSSPSETLFSLLRKDFQTLAAFHADWPERVSRYVIEAGDESVLEEIVTELKQAQQNSRFTGKVPETQRKALADIWWSEPRREFFRTTNITDTPFYHRLARYLNASVWYVGTYEGERYPAENFQVFLDMLHCGGACGVPMHNVVEMFTQAGFPSDHLARQIFNTTCRLPRYEICCTLPGFGEYAATQKEIVCQSLLDPNGLTLRILSEKKFPVGPFAETLVELAFHSAKKTRAPAAALLKTCSEQAIPLVEQRILMAKKNDERLIGLQLLSEMAGADAIPFFEKALELDSMVKVRLTIQEILQSLNPSRGTDLPSLPPVPPIAALVPLPPESTAILEEMTREGVSVYNRSARNRYERDLEWYEQRKSQSFIQPPEEPVYYTFEDLNFENHLKLLSTGTALECDEVKPRIYCATPRFDRLLEKFVEHPGTHLIHVARLLILWGRTPAQHRGIFSWQVAQVEYLDLYRNSHHPPFSLRDLAAVLTALEVDTNALGNRILDHETGWEKRGLFRFEPEAVWPYFAERPHLL
ncbi:MAG TPA: hypothetical protein PLB32_24720, partial [Acidobacteriota bacterium]|nr:hypothetical protein [Acidobacteriota bacterium]